MSDLSDKQGSVPSPCIGICQMNAHTRLCDGCQRTIDEIAQWSTASEETKQAIWDAIRLRQQALF